MTSLADLRRLRSGMRVDNSTSEGGGKLAVDDKQGGVCPKAGEESVVS